MKWKLIHKMYYTAFGDEDQINNLISVVTDVIEGNFPDDSPMGGYTVGELKNTAGFYASPIMLNELSAAMIGRSIRGLCMHLGVSPFHPNVAKLLLETNEQQVRILPILQQKLEEKFGKPQVIDEVKIADLSSRSFKLLQAMLEPKSTIN